jgi:hypothetical protein
MRASGSGCKHSIELKIEALVENEIVRRDSSHVDLVVTFRMDLAEIVLIEEVIADDQSASRPH